MTAANFQAALAFVWGPGRDSPLDGSHTTAGDPGGLTNGGITEATWEAAVQRGLVSGALDTASRDDLSLILQTEYWSPLCDALPSGLDLLFFDGSMMSGAYPKLLQRCLGMIGADVDGMIGLKTLAAVNASDVTTLIKALTGAHYAYLSSLGGWTTFRNGWTTRLLAAETAALALVSNA